MKNSQLAIGIGIILLLLIGGGAYLANSKNSASSPAATTGESINNPESAPQDASEKNTLAGLLASGKNVQCAFTSTGPDQKETKGTVIVHGMRMRGDFTVDTDGKPMMTSMIRDGDTAYMWGSAMPEGIKMKFSPDDIAANENVNKYVDPNMEADYSCKPWSGSESEFVPPAGMTFRDMSAMMDSVKNSTNMMGGSQCAVCDNLEGEAQTACKQQLNCN